VSLERENRTGRGGGFLWRLDLDDKEDRFSSYRGGRRLLLEPHTTPHPDRGAELYVWVEDSRPRYHWISEDPSARPRASDMPTVIIDAIEVPNSRRIEFSKHPLEYTIIQALAKGELVGESAKSAMHTIFWSHFVDDDDGLHYLDKYSKQSSNFYARQRLRQYIEVDYRRERNARAHAARRAVEEAMKDCDRTLGERFCRRVCDEPNMRDAIEALLKTEEPEEMQLRHVRKIVELNATRVDYVIARIADACDSKHALLGLRACQRVERDPDFFACVDAYVLAHPNGAGLVKFLKPHCPKPRPAKAIDEYGLEVDEEDDNEVFDAAG